MPIRTTASKSGTQFAHLRRYFLAAAMTAWCVLTAAPLRADAPPATAPAERAVDKVYDTDLAARIEGIEYSLVSASPGQAQFKVASVLLGAACRLDPDPRYLLLQAQAAHRAGDLDTEIAAYKTYMNTPGYGGDRLVQSTYIQLQAQKMETADAKLEYFKKIMSADSIALEVRAEVAVEAATLMMDQARKSDAINTIERAIQLEPLNMTAQQLHYQWVDSQGTPAQRIKTLLAMLRINPGDFAVLQALAQEAADVGMVAESLDYYRFATAVSNASGVPADRSFILGYGAELYMGGQLQILQPVLASALVSNPYDYRYLELALLVTLDYKDKNPADLESNIENARNVLYNRLETLRQKMGDASATTRPLSTPEPPVFGELGPDIKKLESPDYDKFKNDYMELMSDLAWFEIHYDQKTSEAEPFIQALSKLRGENDPLVVRLTGWSYLVDKKEKEARVKLSAVKDSDPMAAAGLLVMDGASNPDTRSAATKLMGEHPAGMVAARLWQILHGLGATMPVQPDVPKIRETLSKFPKEWLNILSQPQLFYTLSAEPIRVAHSYGEPIYGAVTIKNISDYDIPISDRAVLHPSLWFDAEFKGENQTMAGTSYDRIGQQLILRKGTSITQVVRLDLDAVAKVLNANPTPPIVIQFYVRTNVTTSNQGMILPGGQRVAFDKIVERTPLPIMEENRRMQFLNEAATGGGEQVMGDIELALNFMYSMAAKDMDDATKQFVGRLHDAVQARFTDESNSLRAWALFCAATRTSPADCETMIRTQMLNDPAWQDRLLGLMATTKLSFNTRLKITEDVAQRDTDPTVKAFAQAFGDFMKSMPATTQPATTQSTTQPAATEPSTTQSPSTQP